MRATSLSAQLPGGWACDRRWGCQSQLPLVWIPFLSSQHEHGSLGFGFSPCCLPWVPQARKRPSAVFFGLRLRPLIKFFYLIANLCSHNINPQPPTLSVRLYYLYKSRTTVERSKKKKNEMLNTVIILRHALPLARLHGTAKLCLRSRSLGWWGWHAVYEQVPCETATLQTDVGRCSNHCPSVPALLCSSVDWVIERFGLAG